jgi:pilus assembly protein CpaF
MKSVTAASFFRNSHVSLDCADSDELQFQKTKVSIHEQLIDSLNLSIVSEISHDEFAVEIRSLASQLCKERVKEIPPDNRDRMIIELMDEVFGLGPLEVLMNDPEISDILVNSPQEVYVERHGRLEVTDVIFADAQHVTRIIQRLTSRVGRRIDEVSPMVDARLPDGSRINAVIPPLALDGPVLSIRRFGAKPLGIDDLLKNGSVTNAMADFLLAAVESRVSFLISGGTGAGKTTLLNALSSGIPVDERIVTIEDSAELLLQNQHVVRMETRPANTEGRGEVMQRELIRNALRMRPDRILIGEVRGAEALDMLQAMNTGHEGSLSTIHANDTREALARLEIMVKMSGLDLPIPVIRQYIGAGIRLVVHAARLKGGLRRVVRISEISCPDGERFEVNDIFGFHQTGVDENGIAKGEFYTTGYRPACLNRIRLAGVHVSDRIFDKAGPVAMETSEFPASCFE